jgi:hypothetical protein
MARLLKMATLEQILSLHANGYSRRRIAKELGVSRDAVARCIKTAPLALRPIAEASPDPVGVSNQATAPSDKSFGRISSQRTFRSTAEKGNPSWCAYATAAPGGAVLSSRTRCEASLGRSPQELKLIDSLWVAWPFRKSGAVTSNRR